MEIYVDDEAKLTLHGLVQHYIMLNEEEKNRKLNDLLDALDFNQVHWLHFTAALLVNLLLCRLTFLSFCPQSFMSVGHNTGLKLCIGHAGGHLREIGAACQGAQQAAGGMQLPLHLHPQRAEAGRAVRTPIICSF